MRQNREARRGRAEAARVERAQAKREAKLAQREQEAAPPTELINDAYRRAPVPEPAYSKLGRAG